MKILYIITKSTSGGAQTHISQCAAYMKSRGHDVAVMANPGGWLEKNIIDQGVVFLPNQFLSNSFNPINGIRAMRAISKAVDEWQPDLVSLHSSAAGFWGRIAIHNRVPTIFTAHGWGFGEGVGFVRRCIAIVAERLVSMWAKKIICVSNHDRKLGLQYCIASAKKMITIHNGVEDLHDYVTRTHDPRIRIVWVGRFINPKQPEILLEAVQQLPDDIRSTLRVEYVGDGPKRPLLESLVAQYGLQDQVQFAGDVPRQQVFHTVGARNSNNIPAIFVLTSKHEGFPRSILEAMSLGCAVVASDVGGTREALEEGAGILVKRGDSAGLCNTLLDLLQDPKKISIYSSNARKRMLDHFTLERMLGDTYQAYQDIVIFNT